MLYNYNNVCYKVIMFIHITIYDTEYIFVLIYKICKLTGIRRAEATFHREGKSANCGVRLRNVSYLLFLVAYLIDLSITYTIKHHKIGVL